MKVALLLMRPSIGTWLVDNGCLQLVSGASHVVQQD